MKTLVVISLLITISISPIKANSHGGSGNDGFTLDLIHRDSPLSPLYNPTHTRIDRLKNAFVRSVSRASLISKKVNTFSKIKADIYGIPGEYIMKITIGTPPVQILGIADTGSDLTWTQCKPCTTCYKQVGTPVFTPSASSSYRVLSCQTDSCKTLGEYGQSCGSKNECIYRMTYGDSSFSSGDLATDNFNLGSTSFKNVVFGCGHNNNGTFNETVSGIIGLGGGPLSLIRQLKGIIKGKFSYCLVPQFNNDINDTGSKINFGATAVVSGDDVVLTPLVQKNPSTYYYLTLESVLVGNNNLQYKKSFSRPNFEEGNIIIDSGTTLTLLSGDFYNDLTTALNEAIGAETVEDPQGLFSLCYKDLNPDRIPIITFRFTGADVELPPANTFLEVEKGVTCLTIIPSDELAIFGNLSQGNFLIGYDLINKELSFKSTDCTKH